jgi:hypothetical protein
MTLKITPSYDDKKHSFLSLSVDSGEKKDGHLEVRTLRKLVQNMEPGRREATIESYVRETMQKLIADIVERLEDTVKKAGKFIYPARGVLKFSNPGFTRSGDFLATVTHEPYVYISLRNSLLTVYSLQSGVQVEIPGPVTQAPFGTAPIQTDEAAATPPVLELRLDWKVNPVDFYALQKGKVVLTCKNITESELRFQEIVISIKAGTQDEDAAEVKNRLFAVDEFIDDAAKPAVTQPVKKLDTSAGKTPATQPATTEADSAEKAPAVPAAGQTTEQDDVTVFSKEEIDASDTSKSGAQTSPAKPEQPSKPSSGLLGIFKKPFNSKPSVANTVQGTMRMERSSSDLPVMLVVRSPNEAANNVVAGRQTHSKEWQAVVKPTKATFFTLKKNDWIKITLAGKASIKGEHLVYIDEIWADKKGATDGHRIEQRTIEILDAEDA